MEFCRCIDRSLQAPANDCTSLQDRDVPQLKILRQTANELGLRVDTEGVDAVWFLFGNFCDHLRVKNSMRILVIGGGGREHALVWKLAQSPAVEKIWCAPGNGGIANDAECFPLDLGDVRAAADLAAKLGADLTIVGPEIPLVQGIADEFASRGLALLGPFEGRRSAGRQQDFCKEIHGAARHSHGCGVWNL